MITVIGDVHGKFDQYYNIVKDCEYSVQIGDFGFNSAWNKLHYVGLSPDNHKVLAGNHDCYDTCPHSKFYLGNFGVHTLNGVTFFYIRGGLSIDRVYRVGEELGGSSKTWWSQEELNLKEMLACMDLYKSIKPDIVISHVPPSVICNKIHGNKHNILQKFKFHVGFQENTALLGDQLLEIHRPKYWCAGHHHVSYCEKYMGTVFQGLAELQSTQIRSVIAQDGP